jgi:hypothetical protein
VRLGWGISGYVYLSPDARTAVKIHRYAEGFERELAVYRILRRLKLKSVCGLTVPQLRGHNSSLRAIRMDFVSPPYLLDFAGATFTPPDFPEDVIAEWRAGIDRQFGQNAWMAYAVYDALGKHGIYYTDFRPSNMNVEGLPGVDPPEPGEGEDI